MQRFIALCTAAVHAHSSLKVTVGSASLKWNADATADGRSVARLWSDAALDDAFTAAFAPPSAATASPPPPPPLPARCERWCTARYADAHCRETACLGCGFCADRPQPAATSAAPPLGAALISRLRAAVASGRPTLDLYNTVRCASAPPMEPLSLSLPLSLACGGAWTCELSVGSILSRLRSTFGTGRSDRTACVARSRSFDLWAGLPSLAAGCWLTRDAHPEAMDRDSPAQFGPCQEEASFWQLDKPIVYAELPSHVHSHVDRYATELTQCTVAHGFNGLLFWAYNGALATCLKHLE
jgi:hypothetical protein